MINQKWEVSRFSSVHPVVAKSARRAASACRLRVSCLQHLERHRNASHNLGRPGMMRPALPCILHSVYCILLLMLELKKQQARAPKKQSPSEKQLLDQKLAITDQQIDALVYELYGLTEQEIRTVEGEDK